MSVDDARDELAARRAALRPDQQDALRARLERAARAAGSQRIRRREHPGPARLSFAQQRLWFLDQLVPRNPFYNIPAALPLGHTVDRRTLERAVDEIVRRHESLRTTFPAVDGEPVQLVAPELHVTVTELDLRGAPAEQRALRDEGRREARRPFDLATGPLVRARLVRTTGSDHLLLTMHHIVSDGWSMGVFLRELMVLYTAFAHGRPSPLAELPIQYADFAEWQRQHLSGEVLDRHLAYWREALRDLPRLDLPTDRARPPMPTFRGDNLPVRVPRAVSHAVRRLAAELAATPFMVLLAGFAAVLHRASRQDTIAVGVPIANRTEAQLEPLIGFFVNSLALRIEAEGTVTGRELVARVRETTLGAYAHQDLPFEQLVDELQPARDLSRNPLAQVTMQLQNSPTATGTLPDDDEVELDPSPGTSIVDFALSLWETTGSFLGMVQYSTDLFERDTVASLTDAYLCLLDDLVARPDVPIDQLRLRAPAQAVADLRASPPAPAAATDPTGTLDELVDRAARSSPDATAVVDGERAWTYREIDGWAWDVARRLRDGGVRRGDVVAVDVERSVEQVVGFLAVLRAGAAYLPLDPELPPLRRERMLADAAVRVVLDRVRIGACAAAPPIAREHGADDLAYVLFTSGSTGRPKGVRIAHRAIANHMRWMQHRFPLGADDRVLQRTPTHFDASVWEVWAPLIAGAQLVLHRGAHAADARAVCEALARHGITVVQFVPSVLRLVVDEPRVEDAAVTLRRVFCGGEPLPPGLVREFAQRSRAELVNLYGPTEATVDATAWVCCADDADRARVPIGHPIDGMRAEVVGADGEEAPIGFPGELHLEGVGVADGYVLADPVEAARFSGRAPARRYRTGDVARRRADGALEVLGRVDQQLKVRGHRVEPEEVERTLREHPGVAEALVVGGDAIGGGDVGEVGGGGSLAALVVAAPEHDPTTTADERERVDEWHALYADVYARPNPTADDTFDTTGWESSYDRSPIPPEAMRSWLDETVERLAALRARRVLDVGAGTGLVALRLAASCDDYLAVDFSDAALGRLRSAGAHLPSLRTQRLRADELDELPQGAFDLVVLNSVVQYFPSAAYLARVLDAAGARLAPGGHVVLGDVRDLRLLPAQHLSTLLPGAPDHVRVRSLRDELHRRCRAERELVVDPAWFATDPTLAGRWDIVSTRPKAAPVDSEMTSFRIDVVLRPRPGPGADATAGTAETALPTIVHEHVRSRDELREHLERSTGALVVTGIADARVTTWVEATRLLDVHGDEDVETFRSAITARGAAAEGRSLSPHAALELARAAGRAADVSLSPSDAGRFDLVTWPAGSARPSWAPVWGVTNAAPLRLTTDPVAAMREAELARALRRHASDRLPPPMVPARFLVVAALPRHPNGKLDRTAAPLAGATRPDHPFTAPAGPLETLLAELWAEVLGQARIGATDQFFADLGGHSLLATQLVARLRAIFGDDIPLRIVFDAPTVTQMAVRLAELVADAEHIADVAHRVRSLSDDEVVAALARREPT